MSQHLVGNMENLDGKRHMTPTKLENKVKLLQQPTFFTSFLSNIVVQAHAYGCNWGKTMSSTPESFGIKRTIKERQLRI
jgi:hypothetical protein